MVNRPGQQPGSCAGSHPSPPTGVGLAAGPQVREGPGGGDPAGMGAFAHPLLGVGWEAGDRSSLT